MHGLKTSPLRKVADYAGADGWSYDPWGTAIMLAFDICAVLNAADTEGNLTRAPFTQWDYKPSPYVAVPSLETLATEDNGDSYGERELAQALLDGDITTDDLIYAGNVLNRYTAILRRNGRDY